MEDGGENSDVLYEDQPFHGVSIKAASRKKLIKLCLGCFNEESIAELNPFVKVFFHTYHWYMKTEDLMQHFIDIFDDKGDSGNDNHLYCKVVQAVKYWLDNHGSDFESNEDALSLLDILNTKIQLANFNECAVLLDLKEWYEQKVTNKTNYEAAPFENKSLDFNLLNGETIGDLILFLNWKSLIQIPIWEWREYGKTAKTSSKTPFLKDQIVLFNDVSKYVMGMSLNHTTPEKRALSVHKFIVMSKRLNELNDYNTLLAVIGGLGHSTIARLRKTRELLSMEDKLLIKEMHETLSSDNNYSKYRNLTENINGFIVPILGVIMKDLVSLETAVSDYLEHDNNKLINFHKLVQVSKILEHIIQANNIHPDVCPREDFLSILRVSLKSKYNEDALYELSLEREPRKDSVSSLHRSSISELGTGQFADWATAVSDILPTRETVENHVREMVNVVFDAYDLDKNNYINKDEFDSLATNFSFIDSFAVLDVNGDNNISREEMINYFMNANSQQMTKEFLHDFQEASYFSPHNCVYCTGFLWGMGKVGYRCKVCQISCHRECKNRVVLECRPHRNNSLARSDKSRKGIMKRIKSLDKEWKGSFDTSTFDISGSQNSLLSSSPRTPRAYTNGDVFSPSFDTTDSANISKLRETILKLQAENESLQKENKELKTDRKISESQIEVLQNQLNSVREQSVHFMVEQMERLHSCKETEV